MDQFAQPQPHGPLEEVFPGIHFVTGTMKTQLMGAHWHFSRNMTVVQEGDALTLINSVRLDDAGLRQLDALGRVVNVVRIGALHGLDDAFYKAHYGAAYWAPPGVPQPAGLLPDHTLLPGGSMPFSACSVFAFEHTKLPEAILHIEREGGILVACDALQNWVKPDEFFSAESRQTMAKMASFKRPISARSGNR